MQTFVEGRPSLCHSCNWNTLVACSGPGSSTALSSFVRLLNLYEARDNRLLTLMPSKRIEFKDCGKLMIELSAWVYLTMLR